MDIVKGRLYKLPLSVLFIGLFLCFFVTEATAQVAPTQNEKPPSSDDPQEILKISTEEVRIPVFAFDNRGHFDPTLSTDDLLIREDGIAQRVTGLYRVPAYVLVLADTGGAANPTKTVRLTGDVAAALISNFRPEDLVALMQVNSAVELLNAWSKERSDVIAALRTKLLPTNRNRLAAGIVRATAYLQQTPMGNRHLVIISDGYEQREDRAELDEAIKSLATSGIAVHVISYTSLARKLPPVTYGKAHSNVPEEIAVTLPPMRAVDAYTPDPKDVIRARGAYAIDLDRLIRGKGDVKDEMARRETGFREIAAETGGYAWLPTDVSEMLVEAAEAARDIDSQYVVTYKPLRRLADAKVGEYRKLDVISRRVGLSVRSRRGYVAKLSQ